MERGASSGTTGSDLGSGTNTQRTYQGYTGQSFVDEIDEEWSTPLAKVSKLYYDHESWSYAREILEVPSPACRKVGDEARGLVSRHVIDRLKEKQYLEKIKNVAPRLRSAVELLSKPDADYLYPPIQFVVNELRSKYPEVYDSVISKINVRMPDDMKPKAIVVTIAKNAFENENGDVENNWGKFISLLGLCGALAVDSVEAGYSEGVTEVVDTFGLIVEQIMGEWILSEGGGWEGFIQHNQYEPILSPIPRTIVIVSVVLLLLYFVLRIMIHFLLTDNGHDNFYRFTRPIGIRDYYDSGWACPKPQNPADYLFSIYYYA